MKEYLTDKLDTEKYNCIKQVNVCKKYKEELVNMEGDFYGIKKKNIGYIATILSLISFLPILHNVYKTKKTNNFSYASIALSFLISALWIFYGSHTNSFVTILRSIVFIFIFSSILYVKIFY